MNTPNPKDVPVDEVWEVATPNAQSKYRWIAVRNSPSGLSPWHMVLLGSGGYRRGEDGEITLIQRLTPEVNDDDPIAYSIRQSQVDAVEVRQDGGGNYIADGTVVSFRDGTQGSVDAEIEERHQARIVKLLAVRRVMKTDQDRRRRALEILRGPGADADDSILDALEENWPGIINALARQLDA